MKMNCVHSLRETQYVHLLRASFGKHSRLDLTKQ